MSSFNCFFFLDPVVISQADISRPVVDTLPLEKREIRHLVVASDNSHVAIFYDDGLLWMGNLEDEKVWAPALIQKLSLCPPSRQFSPPT